MADLQTSATGAKPSIPFVGRLKKLARSVGTMAVWVLAVFLAAGRADWRRGWACASVYVITMTITGAIMHRCSHGLLEARAKWRHQSTPLFDRVFIAVFMPLTFVQVVVAGLDAGRFRWWPLPLWTFWPGLVLFLASMGLVLWIFLVNPFAEAVVRIQPDRGHRVISTGPYGVVRHPMYVGLILMYPATGLMFGSGWAVAVSGLMALLIVWRTGREDKYLRANLPGYAEYAACTRYRLLPGIW